MIILRTVLTISMHYIDIILINEREPLSQPGIIRTTRFPRPLANPLSALHAIRIRRKPVREHAIYHDDECYYMKTFLI